MQIAFDYQIFCRQHHGGISRYFAELAAHLDALELAEVNLVAPLHRNASIMTLPRALVWGKYWDHGHKSFYHELVIRANRVLFAGWELLHQPALVHETYFATRPYQRRAATVITMHDLIHERFPPMTGSHSSLKAKAIRRADHIICVSENTRKDLLAWYDVDASKTTVIHHGINVPTASGNAPLPEIGGPYILYVGSRAGYKNFEQLLRAYAGNATLRRDFKLVCMGGEILGAGEAHLMAELNLPPDRVVFLSGGDTLLWALYRQATLLVYPSLYEGFGIPPLEAMACDCPVVCSNTSSLPEVVGSAAEYFDPLNGEMMAYAIERVATAPTRAAELRGLGRENIRRFSWGKCAQEHLAVYQRLLKH